MAFLWIFGVPVASWFDAHLKVAPETEALTTVYVSAAPGRQPEFGDWFVAFLKLNSWEMLLVTVGTFIGAKTWDRKIRVSFPF